MLANLHEIKNIRKDNNHKNNFDDDKGKFEFAIQWHNEISEFKISFCNSVLTTNGGTHEQGFRTGVAKSIRKIAKFKNNKIFVIFEKLFFKIAVDFEPTFANRVLASALDDFCFCFF